MTRQTAVKVIQKQKLVTAPSVILYGRRKTFKPEVQ